MTPLLLRDVRVGQWRGDLLAEDGVISRLDKDIAAPAGTVELDGHGGEVIPGLWDHHVHLMSLAAAGRSVDVRPETVGDLAGLGQALRTAPGGAGWVRAVGFDDTALGPVDRVVLDRLVPDRPVRLQHRSGAMWVVNTAALTALGLDVADQPTGQLFGADDWLRARLPHDEPDLGDLGDRLASFGIVGVTDATPYARRTDLVALGQAALRSLPQHVVAMGGPELAATAAVDGLQLGPVKLVIADHDLPNIDEVADAMRAAHEAGRSVAVHCVTRVALVLALAAWDEVGAQPGDRVEHGSVVPPELAHQLARHGLTVVTQPAFVHDHGDRYLAEVDDDDQPHLYPCASLLAAGVQVAGSTDAPFGTPDPWQAIRAAITRRTRTGQPLLPHEAVPPTTALSLFLGSPDNPAGPHRKVAVGAPADLCLLAAPLEEVLHAPSADQVRATIIGGTLAHTG